jgi:HD-GYP domain-containing protein (c-di-GMP phosphodiesterase class II)
MYRRKLITQKGVHGAILNSIRSTLFEKSFETQEHADRIAYLARRVGELLNLSADDLDLLQLAAGLHDIGKISIDQAILTKPSPLTDDEWKRLQQHPEIGYRITQAIPELSQISEIVLTHHERWDGSGYPQGLKGEQIPLMARIVSVADAFDAMTEGRHYKEAVSKQEAVEELIRQSAGSSTGDCEALYRTGIPVSQRQTRMTADATNKQKNAGAKLHRRFCHYGRLFGIRSACSSMPNRSRQAIYSATR